MINFDDYAIENKTEHNPNWPYTLDHPYRILIIGGSGSGKTYALLNLIEDQPDNDKIFLYAKDLYEAKKLVQIIITILKLILIIQTICTMFTKILMITIQMKIVRH